MPKIVTNESRAAEVKAASRGLAAAIERAMSAEGTEAMALWADVAKRAGAIQRRTRQLAGLGRGG
jgi:hypothetical protein